MSNGNVVPIPQKRKQQKHMAMRHVELLTGSCNARVHLRLVHDRENRARNLFGSIDDLWPTILKGQDEGFGVLIIVNGGGHKDNEITDIRACFIDKDNGPLPSEWHSPPSFKVRRSDNRGHAYWLVHELTGEQFISLQRRLAAYYGGDPRIFNRSRGMRLAGTLHLKGEPQLVMLYADESVNNWDVCQTFEAMTAGLPELVMSEEQEPRPVSPNFSQPDHFYYVDRATYFLQNHEPLVEDDHSDDKILRALFRLRDWGITDDTAVDLVMAHLDCTPKDESWVRVKATNAWKYPQNEWGCDADTRPLGERFPGVEEKEAKQEEAKTSAIVRIYDEKAQDALPDPTWRIDGILPDTGAAAVFAPPKGAKTILATELALSIAANRPALGCFAIVRPGPVYYMTNEGFTGVARRRRPAWRAARGIPADEEIPFYLMDNVPQAADPNAADVYSKIIEAYAKAQPSLIVIDTMSKSLGLMDEDSAPAANAYHRLALALERRFGCGTLTVAHTGKDPARGIRGNNAHMGNFDNLYIVESNKAAKVMKFWPYALKDDDGEWCHHLRSTWNPDLKSYTVSMIDEAGYKRAMKSQDALFLAAVAVAIRFCEMGKPILRQKYDKADQEQVIDEIEETLGRRPKWDEILDALNDAYEAGALSYQSGKTKGFSGYWKPRPPMPDECE
jgi:hypothetical protein